ncbi:hypothetical protein ACN47E_003597 [Coniothyrium glycines]
MAVYPGWLSKRNGANYYHLQCFEDLIDLSQEEHVQRVHPVTAENIIEMRGIEARKAENSTYMVDLGAACLVARWREMMIAKIRQRDEGETVVVARPTTISFQNSDLMLDNSFQTLA